QLNRLSRLGLQEVALGTPNPRAAAEEITATDLFLLSGVQSRATRFAAGRMAVETLSVPDRIALAQMTGAYRQQLTALTSRLTDDERARYERLVASDAWKVATSGEDDLA